MTTSANLVSLSALLVAVFIWFRKPWKASRSSPLPPGPKPLPILGNLTDLTTKELWLPVTEWAKVFGDVVYTHVLGQGLVFLNSPEACIDLLDKRGSIYSDKPQLVMTCDMCGCKNMIAFTGYNDQFKRQRKLMHSALSPKAVQSYQPLAIAETQNFLHRLVGDPASYISHIRRYAGGLTLSIVYGYEAAPKNDKFIAMAEETVDLLANRIASGGGIWPVDIFPFLRHLPSWFPGTGFIRNAEIWKRTLENCVDKPYEYVKESMKSNTHNHSFCSMLLESNEVTPEVDFDLKWVANSMYASSIDTTMTTILHFLLAILENPHTLIRAQAEVDQVVGADRLPGFGDRASLPYVEALLSEALRMGAPVPLSLPHRLMEDDHYRGMYIPKGSLVFANVWSILRDERLYPRASEFNPDRFLEVVEPEVARRRDPRQYIFGFGRRICPGIHLVDSTAWLLVVSIIATFNISKPRNGEGNVVEPNVTFENPIFRMPSAFKIEFTPRSQAAMNLIRKAEIN